jgi:hypothetical protein
MPVPSHASSSITLCSFVVKIMMILQVRLSDGNIMWKTYMAPDNKNQTGGFSGKKSQLNTASGT